jgi:two-component system chemotaxis sensor kinase CheA
MSEINLDDELIEDYLAESCEHLAHIETDLLALEQGGQEIDEQMANRVFRAAHSIKGGAGFFDLIKIRELAHKIQIVLDLIRSREMVPTSEVVSILLLGFDKLRELIQHHQTSGEADISEFVTALAGLTAAHVAAEEEHLVAQLVEVVVPGTSRRVRIPAYDLNRARRAGQCIYLIRYDLIHDIQRRGKTPWGVFKKLIHSGTILETVPDLDSAGTLDDEPSNQLLFEVLYTTAIAPDRIGKLVEVPPERVLLVQGTGARSVAATPQMLSPARQATGLQ